MNNDNRSVFDWVIWTFIHLVVIGAISTVGFYVYTWNLGIWVAASATVAGFASCYLFAKDVPGETLMKVCLGLAVAANAGYLAHNGAKKIGVDDFNNKQVEKFERGMEVAGKASSRRIARELRLGATEASKLETIFSDGMATTAAILAFIELACALLIFALSSRRLKAKEEAAKETRYRLTKAEQQLLARFRLGEQQAPTKPMTGEFPEELDAMATGRLEGKEPRR